MATHSIAGNVAGATTGDIVYLSSVGDYPQPQPQATVVDSNKDYIFSALSDGVYIVYAATKPLAKKQVILSGANIAAVNLTA